LLSDNDFSGYFGGSFLAGSEPNRRMTDAAYNQHSETRRPSDRDDSDGRFEETVAMILGYGDKVLN
jgi:hypothetical protein